MNQEKIGAFIQEKRKEKKITQQELAKKLGITNRTISNWEKAKCLPDYNLLIPLTKELDISVSELINGEEDNNDSDSAVEKTICYTSKRIKKIKKKSIFIIFYALFTIIILIWIGYKFFIIKQVSSISNNIYVMKQKDTSKTRFGAPVFIQNKKTHNYYQFKELKMENIFKNAVINEESIDNISFLFEKNKLLYIGTESLFSDNFKSFKKANNIVNNQK